MNITTRQAADKLGVSCVVVRSMAKHGLLTDLKPVNPKHQKHYGEWDSKEVSTLAAAYRSFRGAKLSDKLATQIKQAMMNGYAPSTVTAAQINKHAAIAKAPETKPKIDGIVTRLDRIEGMLKQLLAIWS